MDKDKVDFDQFADNYQDVHNQAITITGEDSSYFDFYKIDCLKRWVIKESEDIHLFDFGCGVGKMAGHLAQAFPSAKVSGFDISSQSIEFARKTYTGLSNIDFFDYIPQDIKFDFINAANVFHHITPEERLDTLEVLFSILKDSGQLVIFEHNPLNPLTRYSVRICPFDADAVLIWPKNFVKLAECIGFRLVIKKYIVFFPNALRVLRRFEPKLGFLNLGAQYMLVLEKK